MAFEVDSSGILQPLGVRVLRDNRIDLLPSTRDYTEEIPGRAGEFDFGCDLGPGVLELSCFLAITPAQWPAKRVEMAKYLNPLLGTQSLTFANDPGKVYMVRYAGKLPVEHKYVNARKFVIPFKMFDPYIISATQNTLQGSGTAFNAGIVPTPFTLNIQGPVTAPSVTVGAYTMSYTGTIASGKALVIDTAKRTAIYDNMNAMPNFNKVFPKLDIGSNAVIASEQGITTIRWHDHWM